MRVGIDLGTSYSLVSRIGPEGKPILMPDYSEQDAFHTPSQVYIDGDRALIGRAVDALLEQRPELNSQVIRFFKRHFGETVPLFTDSMGRSWYPEAIAALVLRKLKLDAESAAGLKLQSALITVPAHFNDLQRQAVLNAAMLADIVPLGLIDEPIAAALHYGISSGQHDRTLLAYDFGGGTFDATVLTLTQKGTYVLSKSGATDLGGKDIDERVVQIILEQFEEALGHPFKPTPLALIEARRVAEEIKIDLCTPGRRASRKTVLLSGEAIEVVLSREKFDEAISDLIQRTLDVMLQCIRDSGLSPSSIDTVLLVGGSSLVPIVLDRIRNIFSAPGQEVLHHEPSKAVALGAAMYSAQLGGDLMAFNFPPEMRGVSGYNVGLRIVNSRTGRTSIDTIIKKNARLPALAKKRYYTARPDQSRIVLSVVQFLQDNEVTDLGEVVVGPFLSPRRNYPMDVTVECKEDGTVSIRAYDAETGAELSHVFSRSGFDAIARLASQRLQVRGMVLNSAS